MHWIRLSPNIYRSAYGYEVYRVGNFWDNRWQYKTPGSKGIPCASLLDGMEKCHKHYTQ